MIEGGCMFEYSRKVHYYETDKMGITHHSNYIRWMEEARIAFLEQIGFGYAKFESEGMVSPVLAVECQYKHSTTFDDELKIAVSVEKYNGVKVRFQYEIVKTASGELAAVGKTEHCFLDKNGRPLVARKALPEFDAALKNLTDRPCGDR